jgi:hypothetical protein
MRKTRLQIFGTFLIVSLLLFIYLQIASRILFTSVDFDEGYNLQVSYLLHTNPLNYASFYSIFDSNITTGPTVLIPAAFFINDQSSLLPRIVMFLYAVIFLFLALKYVFTSKLQRIIFLILVILTPLFYFFSSHILGELPGFAFLLLSLITLSKKHYLTAGLFLACSIITKQVYLFGVLPVFLLFLLTHTFSRKQLCYLSLHSAQTVSGFLIMFFLWFVYILTAVHFSYSSFVKIIQDNIQAMRALSQPQLALIDQRLDMLRYVFGINGILAVIVMGVVCWYIFKNLGKHRNRIAISLAFYCLIYLLYFLFRGSTFWYRQFYPAVLAFIIIVPVFIDTIIANKNKIQLAALAIVIVSLTGNAVYYSIHIPRADISKKMLEQNLNFFREKPLSFTAPDQILKSQLQTADYIKNAIPGHKLVAGISWWNAAEIAYLARTNIGRDPFLPKVEYVITDYYGNFLGTSDYAYLALIKNKTEIYHSPGFTIYRKQ